MKLLHPCELCGAKASVYCPSDIAFLCCSCDSKVHQANFLVARHIRQPVCSSCSNFTANADSFNDSHSCLVEEESYSISSSCISDSSDCISSTISPGKTYSSRKTKGDDDFELGSDIRTQTSQRGANISEAEGVFVNWSRQLGFEDGEGVVRMACSALRVCLTGRRRNFPFHVYLAASMWLSLKQGRAENLMSRNVLMRLEGISGVPARVVVAAEARLARALRHRRLNIQHQAELQEGWAES